MNTVILEYFRVNRGNYKLEDLKKKVLAAKYSQKDIDDALSKLNNQSKGKAPSVETTINKINKTNISPTEIKKPISQTIPKPAKQEAVRKKPKKPRKKLWAFLGSLILLLIAVGAAVWIFWEEIQSLIG